MNGLRVGSDRRMRDGAFGRVMARKCSLSVASVALLCSLMGAAVAQECDVSVSFVNFGSVDFRAGGAITGRLSVRCDRPQAFAIAASSGHGSYRDRRMRGPGGAEIRYNLFVDPAHRQIWGDGRADGTTLVVGKTDGREASHVIYGFVLKGQSAPPGQYSDALVVTLER